VFTAIREYDAKLLLAYWLERAPAIDPSAQLKTEFIFPAPKVAQISWDPSTNSITPDSHLPGWVFSDKLVAKPDQLIKRRGKAGLLALNKTWEEAKQWIAQRAGKPQKVWIKPFDLLLLGRTRDRPAHRKARLTCVSYYVPFSLFAFRSLSSSLRHPPAFRRHVTDLPFISITSKTKTFTNKRDLRFLLRRSRPSQAL
jgi:hypothetical protein